MSASAFNELAPVQPEARPVSLYLIYIATYLLL
jgi:hypothetical protein